MKICKKCGCLFETKSGSVCVSCKKKNKATYNKAYRETNRSKINAHDRTYREANKDKSKAYREANKDKMKACQKIYYQDNQNKLNTQHKVYREANKDKMKAYKKTYHQDNKDKRNAYLKKYRLRRKTQEGATMRRLNHAVSSTIFRGLKNGKGGKSWKSLVPYTLTQLKKHLEKQFTEGMSWETYGKKGWELDHKIPISVHNFTKPEHEDFKKCWALKNLQPMFAKENIVKSNKLTKHFQPSLLL